MRRPYRSHLAALAMVAVAGLLAERALAVDLPEVEPNDTKLLANAVVLSPGDTLSGVTTGGSTTIPGQSSADYFRVRTPPQPLGIYRRQLALTSTPAGHTVTLRGLSQVGGVINALSDVGVQMGVATTAPARAVAWYGFGREDEVHFRVVGTAATTGAYLATLSSTVVWPTTTLGLLYEGPITISAAASGGSTIDPDTWLYDVAFNAIPAAGNDDISGSASAGPSSFTRVLTPGIYTLALAPYQFMNDQPSPSDDDWRGGNVLDFPNAVLASTVGAAGSAQIGLVDVTFNDGLNSTVAVSVNFAPGRIGEVHFVQFTVLADPNPTGACCRQDGLCEVRTQARCQQIAGQFQGDAAACQTVACPPFGACCDSGGCCTVSFAESCNTGVWIAGAMCVPNPCAAPQNDSCATAVELSPGEVFIGSNCNAQSNGDGPAATCQGTSGRGVWFNFTPASTGLYSISACGSPQDTVLQIFTSADCSNFVTTVCDDDSCDDASPPGSGLASVISSTTLTAGVTYRIRLSSFGAAPSGGPFTLVVNQVLPTGACCVNSCCSIATQPVCAGTWTEGGGCTPNPCQAPLNDSCSSAIALVLGEPSIGGTCNATSSADGPAAWCQATASKGVWFSFIPSHNASYRISACGSTHDTVAQIFTSADCVNFAAVACDDNSCDGVNPPGSANASVITATNLTAGASYLIRLSSFGASAAGGAFTLQVSNNSVLGNCCDQGACTLTDAGGCPAPGVFTAGAACKPDFCQPVSGACCCGSVCVVSASAACGGANQRYVGNGVSCNAAGNPASPCCHADFNQSGAVSVQDIFDFLAAYFGGEPCSDINQSGPPPSVQDIFDYLAVYFAGCD